MDLSYKLIQDFVKATSDKKRKTDENNHAYGYVTYVDGEPHVQLDGAEGATPVATTSTLKEGDRVLVLIEKHTATVIGNVTAPSATIVDIDNVIDEMSSIEIQAESQTFVYDQDTSVYLPETITLTPRLHGVDDLDKVVWYWTTAGEDSWYEIDDTEYSTTDPYLNEDKALVVPRNASVFSTSMAVQFKAVYVDDDQELYNDVMSVFRVRDAADGESTYSIILSNESLSIPVNGNYIPLASGQYSCTVTAFLGTTPLIPTNNQELDSGEFKIAASTSQTGVTIDTSTTAGTVIFTISDQNAISPSFEISINVYISGLSGYIRKVISVASSVIGDKGEDATTIRIDSSRGVLFKSNYFSTVLSVTIFRGPKTITTASAMRAEYGSGAYLQWYWRKFDDEDWRTMLVSDSHIQNDGFSLMVTPDDVDEKIVFKCDLVV